MHDVDWSDHRFALACVPDVREVTALDLDTCDLYWEKHGGETGVAFFSDPITANRYLRFRNLVGYNVVGLPDPAFAVEASLRRLRCNVAYLFQEVKPGSFVRNVTEFRPQAEDGQHRTQTL
jgi:hypothetical protein